MAFASQKRESLSEQRWRVFWRKTRTYRDKLSDGPINSNRADFELDFKLPGQDSNLDKENQNLLCYRYTTGYRIGSDSHQTSEVLKTSEVSGNLTHFV